MWIKDWDSPKEVRTQPPQWTHPCHVQFQLEVEYDCFLPPDREIDWYGDSDPADDLSKDDHADDIVFRVHFTLQVADEGVQAAHGDWSRVPSDSMLKIDINEEIYHCKKRSHSYYFQRLPDLLWR